MSVGRGGPLAAALAAVTLCLDGSDPYAAALEAFANLPAPTYAQAQGVREGRCVDAVNRCQERNSALVAIAGARRYLFEAGFEEPGEAGRMKGWSAELILRVLGPIKDQFGEVSESPLSVAHGRGDVRLYVRGKGEAFMAAYVWEGGEPVLIRPRGAARAAAVEPGQTFLICRYDGAKWTP